MAEPSISVYRDLIAPIGERLRADERFVELKNIVYDSDEVGFAEMPALVYYVETPWEDVARGSGSYTLQTRRLTVRMVFTLWVYDAQSRQRMDEAMFHLGGLLLDWLREQTDFDSSQGVGLGKAPLVWQVARPDTKEGHVGVHSISAEFEIYSGTGK